MFKKVFFVLSFALGLFVTKINAYPIVIVSYSNNCFIGCGSVEDGKKLMTYEMPDGSSYTVWERTVKCSGFGFKGCPITFQDIRDGAGDPSPINWIDHIAGQMFDYAVAQIGNSILSGNCTQTYVNTETGESATLLVYWERIQDNLGNVISESIVVSKI